MSEATEIESPHLLMEGGRASLDTLKKEETEIIEHVARRGFRAATSRERVMTEAQIVEEHLHKNRKRLVVLGH